MSEISLEDLSAAIFEDLNASVRSVTLEQSHFRIVLECDDWQESGRKRAFQLRFNGVAETTLTPGWFGNIFVETEHPLLWKHNEAHLSMYFSSAPNAPTALIGELYERHQELVSDWRLLSETLHADSALLKSGYGLFAQGPKRIIEEFARLVDGRLNYSILPAYLPQGGYRVALFDSQFVIFKNVEVTELPLIA
jgi:hypothetical protein